jgi:hypothetical protein
VNSSSIEIIVQFMNDALIRKVPPTVLLIKKAAESLFKEDQAGEMQFVDLSRDSPFPRKRDKSMEVCVNTIFVVSSCFSLCKH